MHLYLKAAFPASGLAFLLLAGLKPVGAQRPLYDNVRLKTRFRLIENAKSDIILPPAASSIIEANSGFYARAAAAIYQASGGDPFKLKGQDYGIAILARYAYADYIDDPDLGAGSLQRAIASCSLRRQKAGPIGSASNGEDYDMLLNLYIALIYKYYDDLQSTREHIINDLLTVRGPLGTHESECENCSKVATIPETENHLFMIETARYLTNQLLYQRTHLPQYDNRRNGKGSGPQATAVWLLDQLRGRLVRDFDEYNARPYQDQIMMSLLNLASYAYDDDVRLSARMVLDYISAKIAVSSNDLRRVPPFRRRNEDQHWGPNLPGFGRSLFLRSPVIKARLFTDVPNPWLWYEPDPQGAWYAVLAGNTKLLGRSAPGTPGPGNFGFAMVLAGTHDYRIPDSILDLFVNGADRRFYQRFHHMHTTRDSGRLEVADELYAGSPSYLITAGGHPVFYCYQGSVGRVFSGKAGDLGSAMPTTFMPSGFGESTNSDSTLDHMIQFGSYTDQTTDNDVVKYHMGVAPDFAAGYLAYIPPEILNDPTRRKHGHWIFVDRAPHRGEQKPGYYLAIYNAPPVAFLEAYDTWLHPKGLTFSQFAQNIFDRYGSMTFSERQENSYVTQSGQAIRFRIAPITDIVSTTDEPEPPGYKEKFTHGTIIDSESGSGIVVIRNPAQGSQITLNMHDVFHPTRISESGEVQRAGWDIHQEVWVDFASRVRDEAGDFYHPFKTLTAARNAVAAGGTINIIPGSKNEAIVIGNRMTIRSFPGAPGPQQHLQPGATIGRQ